MKNYIRYTIALFVLITFSLLGWYVYKLNNEIVQEKAKVNSLNAEIESVKEKQSSYICTYGRYGLEIQSSDGSYPENYTTEVYRNVREVKAENGKLLNSFEDYTLRLNSATNTFVLDLYERDGMGIVLEGSFLEKYTKSEDYITGGYITLKYSTSGYGTALPASMVFKVVNVDPLILELDTDLAPAISYPKKGTQYAFYWKE